MARIFKPSKKKPDGTVWQSEKFYGEYTNHKGKQKRVPLHTNRKQAQHLLDEILAKETRLRAGLEIAEEPQESMSIGELRELFLKAMEIRLRPHTLKDYRRDLKHLFDGGKKRKEPWLPGIHRVSDLSVQEITKYHRRVLEEKLSPRTANRLLAPLTAMLGWAVQQGHIQANPIQGVKSLPIQPKGCRAFEEEEIKKLLDVSPDHARDAWVLLLDLGLRRAELANLTVEDVRDGQVTVQADKAKNKRSRTIPASNVLSMRCAESTGP